MSDTANASPAGWTDAELPHLEDLRVFVTVAETGSFRSAGAHLYTSQPTISRAIARLETQLGVQLLRRTPRGVHLTRHGEALHARARRLLASAADLRGDVAGLADGTLRLGATATSARRLLAPFLAGWLPQHPRIHVIATEDSERRLHSHLQTGLCDLAVVSSPLSANLDTIRLVTVQVIALFPPDHPLSGPDTPVHATDLAAEPLLVNGPAYPSTSILLRALDRAGLRADFVYECSAGQTLAAMAEAGLGVAVFGDTADLRGFPLTRRPVLDASGAPLCFDLYVAWLRDAVPSWVHDFAVGLSTYHRSGGATDERAER